RNPWLLVLKKSWRCKHHAILFSILISPCAVRENYDEWSRAEVSENWTTPFNCVAEAQLDLHQGLSQIHADTRINFEGRQEHSSLKIVLLDTLRMPYAKLIHSDQVSTFEDPQGVRNLKEVE